MTEKINNKNFVFVNEVGPRDGLQNQTVQLEPENRIALIDKLLGAGVPGVEAASFVNPKAVPRMAGAGEIVQGLSKHDGFISVLVPNLRGYDMAKEAGAKVVNVVPAASDTMNRKNINMSLEETLEQSCAILQQAKSDGLVGQAYIATAVECPFEGLVEIEKVVEIAHQLVDAGAQEIIIADTIGAANPAQVKALFTRLGAEFDIAHVSAHFHDTRAMGLANAFAALECGVRKFDASIGGLGGCPFAPGAAGNMATEDLVSMLHQMGYETGIDETRLLEASDFAAELTGLCIGGRMSGWFKSRQKTMDS